MNKKMVLIAGLLSLIMVFGLAACGSSSEVSSDTQEVTIVEAQTVEQAIEDKVAESANAQAQETDFIGSWIDVNAADRFVNITKEGDALQYEDNEGKLPAALANGVLTLTVSDTDSATLYIDAKTGNLKLIYQDNVSEYKKK